MGYVYLIQPAELKDTNRYRIGYTSSRNVLDISRGSMKHSQLICALHCANPKQIGAMIVKDFQKRFIILTGRKYFIGEIGRVYPFFLSCFDKHFKDTIGHVSGS
jgi:hypothetical protein